MEKARNPLRVGISGSYGGLNLGDEAILQCMVTQLRESMPVEITVFSRDPEDTSRRHAVDKALAAAKTFKYNSPRGPISIDPDTRDIVMNEYLSEVVKAPDGRLQQKVIATIPNVKDPCKALKVGPCG